MDVVSSNDLSRGRALRCRWNSLSGEDSEVLVDLGVLASGELSSGLLVSKSKSMFMSVESPEQNSFSGGMSGLWRRTGVDDRMYESSTSSSFLE